MSELTVGQMIEEKGLDFQFEIIAGEEGKERKIAVPDVDRPGIALAGFFEHFRHERMQVLGMGEHAYIHSLPSERRKEIIDKFFGYQIPCVIITRNLGPIKELVEGAIKHKIPLISTVFETTHFVAEVTNYLEEKLAPVTTIHGVLVGVYGLGVLILGESGIGKSECALELLKRGHLLVADDIIEIRHKPGGILYGSGQEIIRHHMEIRGLGIIDVRSLFGIGSIMDRTRIELVVRLVGPEEFNECDRVGLEERYTTILGTKIPEMVVPVRPGRNLAVIIEVAAMNQRLKNKGYFAARELNRRLIKMMSKDKLAEG